MGLRSSLARGASLWRRPSSRSGAATWVLTSPGSMALRSRNELQQAALGAVGENVERTIGTLCHDTDTFTLRQEVLQQPRLHV